MFLSMSLTASYTLSRSSAFLVRVPERRRGGGEGLVAHVAAGRGLAQRRLRLQHNAALEVQLCEPELARGRVGEAVRVRVRVAVREGRARAAVRQEPQQPGGQQPTERSVAQAEAGGEMDDLPPEVLAEVQRLAQMQGQSPPQ